MNKNWVGAPYIHLICVKLREMFRIKVSWIHIQHNTYLHISRWSYHQNEWKSRVHFFPECEKMNSSFNQKISSEYSDSSEFSVSAKITNWKILQKRKTTKFIVNAIAGLTGRIQSSKKKYLSPVNHFTSTFLSQLWYLSGKCHPSTLTVGKGSSFL